VLIHDERATVTTSEVGTVPMKTLGTNDGTLVYSTTASYGDEATIITWFDGNEETQAAGT
jgi:hypothetical protein